jgi:hypothetical protein
MENEWNNYIQELSDKYGKPTNLIWISKKRKKYVLDFAYARILVINDEIYKFENIVSCKIEKLQQTETEGPYALLIEIKKNAELIISLTVWSKSTADIVNDLMQQIILSNKICNELLRQ